jgi:predicted DNA-binding transcriptional regulator AlpA
MRTVTRADIAQITGYSAKYVRDNLTKRPDFPKPVIRLSTQNVRWLEADVMKWMKEVTQAA